MRAAQEAALRRDWELRNAKNLVRKDAKGRIEDVESRSLYVNWRRVQKPLNADLDAVDAVLKRRDASLLLALENYRLCVLYRTGAWARNTGSGLGKQEVSQHAQASIPRGHVASLLGLNMSLPRRC